ncbi:lycopene cyclase domain-containing protein [Corynebacterium camporealensis]
MGSLYLIFLLVTIVCMALCDYRWKLTFFSPQPGKALGISVALVVLFLLWDWAGIATGTFFRGDAGYMTGILLAPEMPIEEPIFLFFLSYLLLNLTTGARRMWR